ncbi:MAG: ATP-binding cassette domain-containing protein, partial [Planctomycetes bacterium]|nr:ATP-binding cassette domain-containing protein [Planctomycetota bacterium]
MVDTNSSRSAPGEPFVRVERLWVEFAQRRVLRDLTLNVARGETVAIIGESGCGKTVLLKTLIGLLRPTRGTVVFDGQDLAKLRERELTRQRIRFGFLFQQAALFDSMTVGQNVAFPLRQHTRKPEREVREVVLTRLAEVGLPKDVVWQKPAELSG